MKKVMNILTIFISSIIILLSLVFIFIEVRLLFSLDWIIYDNAFNGFIRYLFRLIISIYVGFVGLMEIINIKKQKDILLYFNISLVLISIILLFTTTNYVGTICIIVSVLLLIIKLIKYLLEKR